MTRLIFIRHGESNTTVARRIGGFRTCSGLSPLGRRQAQNLRDRLATSGEIDADVLISSQFSRARETAEIVAPALGGLEIEEVEGFGEHDPGEECDGITFDEFVERYGERDWESDPFSIGFPGGETLARFHLRIGEAIADTLRRHAGKTIVVFCHGGVVDAALRQALKAPAVGAFDIWTLNTSITELQLVKPGRWRLLRYNDHAHLAGLEKETPKSVVEAVIDADEEGAHVAVATGANETVVEAVAERAVEDAGEAVAECAAEAGVGRADEAVQDPQPA